MPKEPKRCAMQGCNNLLLRDWEQIPACVSCINKATETIFAHFEANVRPEHKAEMDSWLVVGRAQIKM